MANRHRGDVDLVLGDGRLTLRLTLGALAEIEAAFGASDLVALGERLQGGRLAARDLVTLLGAAARGAGGQQSDAELARQITAADMPACIAAIGALFAETFGDAP
jgi:hypothetical protein